MANFAIWLLVIIYNDVSIGKHAVTCIIPVGVVGHVLCIFVGIVMHVFSMPNINDLNRIVSFTGA